MRFERDSQKELGSFRNEVITTVLRAARLNNRCGIRHAIDVPSITAPKLTKNYQDDQDDQKRPKLGEKVDSSAKLAISALLTTFLCYLIMSIDASRVSAKHAAPANKATVSLVFRFYVDPTFGALRNSRRNIFPILDLGRGSVRNSMTRGIL